MSNPLFLSRLAPLAVAAGIFLVAACGVEPVTAPEEADASFFLLSPTEASAAMEKVDICHWNESGEYTKISVAEAAHGTHVDHGDRPVNWIGECPSGCDDKMVCETL